MTEVKETVVENTPKTYTIEEYFALETKYKALETQLAEANKTIQGYKDMDIDSIKKSVEDYKTKYEQSEADRKAFEHKTKVSAYVRGLNLKDDIYENYITNELITKGLKFEGGKLIGGDDVVSVFTVFEWNDSTANLQFVCGHPKFATRVNEWSVPVKLEDMKDGKHIGASWINGRQVYAHTVTRANAVYSVYSPSLLVGTLAKGSTKKTVIATISSGNTGTTYAYKVNPTIRATYGQTSTEYNGTSLTSGSTEITASVGDVIEIVNLSGDKIVAVAYMTVTEVA